MHLYTQFLTAIFRPRDACLGHNRISSGSPQEAWPSIVQA